MNATMKKRSVDDLPVDSAVQQTAQILSISQARTGVNSNLPTWDNETPPAKPIDEAPPPVETKKVEATTDAIFADLSRRKSPTATIQNFRKLLQVMGAKVSFNELSRRCEISLPDFKATTDNAEEIAVAMIMSEAARLELPESTVDRYLLVEADRNAYNPFRDFVLSRPWDGVSRIETLASCIVTKTPEWAKFGIRKMLIGAVAGNFNPKGIGDPPPVPVLTGKQFTGKSTFFRRMAPPDVDRSYLEGVTLDPSNKDSVMECTTHAIVELGELDATFRKADIARLKSFLSRHKDTYREPYARRDITRARRTVYAGTVNEPRFLVDPTGNRRFVVIEVSDVKLFDGDMQQVWAEAYELWKRGEPHALTRPQVAELNKHNLQFTQHDEVHDLVSDRLKWVKYDKAKYTYRTATDVAIMVGLKPDKGITNRVYACIRGLQVEYEIPDAVRIDRKGRYAVPK